MGLTLAEAFILLAFALLLLFAFWQSEMERDNTQDVQRFRNLPSDQQRDVLNVVQDESLQAIIEFRNKLEESLENPEELWRFIDRDEVRRLLESASRLPEDMQRDLADLVESEKARDVLRQMAVLEKLVAEGWSINGLVKDIEFLEESGIAAGDLEEKITAMGEQRDELSLEVGMVEAQNTALEAELNELRDGMSQDVEDAQAQSAALEAEKVALEAELRELRDRTSQEFGGAEDRNAALEETLRDELGDLVSGFGGRIGVDGMVTFPPYAFFEGGKADITPEAAKKLSELCPLWLKVLVDSGVEIWEARIEGHASSEWRSVPSAHEAYLGNLDLSQRRSQAVLRHCLESVNAPEVLAWARSHLVAVGYSSARPVMNDGQEDRAASRRVVFSYVPNTESLIATQNP